MTSYLCSYLGLGSTKVVTENTARAFRIVGKTMRTTMGCFVLLGGLVYLTGCPNTGGKTTPAPVAPTPTPIPKPAPSGEGQTGGSSEPKISVSDTPLSVVFNENGPETTVTLPYASQGGVVPTSCTTVDTADAAAPSVLTVTTPCTCSDGVCRVGLQPKPKVYGSGSFEFRLSGRSDQKEISSNAGKASVEVLEVKLSLRGNGQEGMVGNSIKDPIVVSVQNSKEEPVSGVDIFWDVKKITYSVPTGETDDPKWYSTISACTTKTDDRGLAQCTWTLGTRNPVGLSQAVNVAAFYKIDYAKGEKAYRETLGGSFSASVKSGSAATLAFRTQAYSASDAFVNAGPRLFYGPGGSTILSTKVERAGIALGEMDVSADGTGQYELWVFAQDRDGNATVIDSGVDVSLSLTSMKPDGANFSAGEDPKGKMTDGELSDRGVKWTQGVVKFKNVKLNKAGKYLLSAEAANLRVSDKKDDFRAEFKVSPGVDFKLSFSTLPIGGIAEKVWTQQPTVTVLDAFDNIATSSGAEVSLSVTGTGVLSGETTRKASKGVVAFSKLFIDKEGAAYKLTAKSDGLKEVSSTFDISPNSGSIGPTASAIFYENEPERSVDLPATGSPASCTVSSPLLVTAKSCTCTGGECRVKVQPEPRSTGAGSFTFSLFDGSGIQLGGTGKVSVEVLGVVVSVVSGNDQRGTIGTVLPKPIVISVKNSKETPISGIRVFSEVEQKYVLAPGFKITSGGSGEAACSDSTNSQGLAECTWTLGTKILHGLSSQTVKVSVFNEASKSYKDALVGSFSAPVKSDSATVLSFLTQNYSGLGSISYIDSSPLIKQKVGVPLGTKKGSLVVYAQDQYGNATTVKEGTTVTLSLGETKPDGAALSGTVTRTMSNEPLYYSRGGKRWTWTQGLAKFDDIKVDKEGEYTLSAASDGFKTDVSFGWKFTIAK